MTKITIHGSWNEVPNVTEVLHLDIEKEIDSSHYKQRDHYRWNEVPNAILILIRSYAGESYVTEVLPFDIDKEIEEEREQQISEIKHKLHFDEMEIDYIIHIEKFNACISIVDHKEPAVYHDWTPHPFYSGWMKYLNCT